MANAEPNAAAAADAEGDAGAKPVGNVRGRLEASSNVPAGAGPEATSRRSPQPNVGAGRHAEADVHSDANTGSEALPNGGSEALPEVGSEPGVNAGPDAKSKPMANGSAKAGVNVGRGAGSQTVFDGISKTRIGSKTGSKTRVGSESGSHVGSKTSSKTGSHVGSKTTSKTGVNVGSNAKSKPVSNSGSKTGGGSKTRSKTGVNAGGAGPEPVSDVSSKTMANVDPKAEANVGSAIGS